tara:strand:+ start:397 stop:720 length:324 start_codon:yes stop_codon:yes gene_type:complete
MKQIIIDILFYYPTVGLYHVIKYFRESYEKSKIAFFCELGETILVCGASAILTYTVLNPATKMFIPMFFFGSILGMISTFYRKAAFATVLTGWFVVANFIALIKLFG